MKIAEDFTFKRKYFVKDLLSPDSLIKGADIVEYASFGEFAQTFLRDKLYSLGSVGKIIVPVESADEVALLLKISPNARPFLIIYLKDFSKETRDAFSHFVDKTAILCDSGSIRDLRTAMVEEQSLAFIDFMKHTYGYFRSYVDRDRINDIPYVYSEPFTTLPFFCTADVKWKYDTFENMPLKDLHGIVYNTTLVANNVVKQERNVDWDRFGGEGSTRFTYELMHVANPKRIFISDGRIFLDDGTYGSGVDMYDPDFANAENIPLREIDLLRNPFDAKLTKSCGVEDVALVYVTQNILCNGNPAMVPYLCKIVARTLNGGSV